MSSLELCQGVHVEVGVLREGVSNHIKASKLHLHIDQRRVVLKALILTVHALVLRLPTLTSGTHTMTDTHNHTSTMYMYMYMNTQKNVHAHTLIFSKSQPLTLSISSYKLPHLTHSGVVSL